MEKANKSASSSSFNFSSINFLIPELLEFFTCLSHCETIILFSPFNSIQSATVQIAAISIQLCKYNLDSFS
ncbi:MAG: hypothetical protein LBC61_06690 [Candidatus Peribacteria bacterium]|nr:hypothetical protein [Candidatus Peribacteria bacterium]